MYNSVALTSLEVVLEEKKPIWLYFNKKRRLSGS